MPNCSVMSCPPPLPPLCKGGRTFVSDGYLDTPGLPYPWPWSPARPAGSVGPWPWSWQAAVIRSGWWLDAQRELDDLAREVTSAGGRAHAAAADVGDRQALHAAIQQVANALGPIGILVANAGIGIPTQLDPLNVTDVEETFRVNLLGVVYSIEAVLPAMLDRGWGQLVAVSSMASLKGLPGESAYCASKAAVNLYMEGLRIALRNRGIAVTTICPGFVATTITPMDCGRHALRDIPPGRRRKIARAIDRRTSGVVQFPWPMAMLMGLIRRLPDSLVARLVGHEQAGSRPVRSLCEVSRQMVDLALKMVLDEKGRFLATVLGVGFAVALVLIQVGLFFGLLENASITIDKLDADLWVMARNTANVDFGNPFPETFVQRVRSIPGVARADNLIVWYAVVALPTGAKESVIYYALEDFERWAFPWKVIEGNTADLRRGRFVMLDESADAGSGRSRSATRANFRGWASRSSGESRRPLVHDQPDGVSRLPARPAAFSRRAGGSNNVHPRQARALGRYAGSPRRDSEPAAAQRRPHPG